MPTIKGTKFTEEHKKNLSIALKGVNKGKVHTKETRKKMSLAKLGKKFSEEHKRKIGVAQLGNKHWLGKKHNPRYFEKISGEKSVNWRGEKIGYLALHSWVRKHLGKPCKCEFCGIEAETSNGFEWANKSGEYKMSSFNG